MVSGWIGMLHASLLIEDVVHLHHHPVKSKRSMSAMIQKEPYPFHQEASSDLWGQSF